MSADVGSPEEVIEKAVATVQAALAGELLSATTPIRARYKKAIRAIHKAVDIT